MSNRFILAVIVAAISFGAAACGHNTSDQINPECTHECATATAGSQQPAAAQQNVISNRDYSADHLKAGDVPAVPATVPTATVPTSTPTQMPAVAVPAAVAMPPEATAIPRPAAYGFEPEAVAAPANTQGVGGTR
jgi:hypothetical protein